ncbi:hypothetical protein Goari_024184 [Gossypium aridum]|uniref:DUF7745 domain-containing protein n=1 Tax=Gossypium aridum TaxID=34290 RepID=A0A7J8X5A3_GOSAI|nr:hypothetical protein [Gossypium aridum]
MEKRFLDKVEDNMAVRIWSEKTQQEKGDSLTEAKCQNYEISIASYWNPAYSCFIFGNVDLVPTIEEYTTLLRCQRIQADKAYSKAANVLTFLRRLISIIGMSEQWDLILTHPDMKKRVDVFVLSIYELVISPKALGHINDTVSDLFDWLDKRVTSRVFSKNSC